MQEIHITQLLNKKRLCSLGRPTWAVIVPERSANTQDASKVLGSMCLSRQTKKGVRQLLPGGHGLPLTHVVENFGKRKSSFPKLLIVVVVVTLLVRDSGSCSSIPLSSNNFCHAFDRTNSSAFDSRVLRILAGD